MQSETSRINLKANQEDPVLSVSDFSLKISGTSSNVIDNISFEVGPGKTLCIVGESGCGKSVTALSIMGLLSKKVFQVVSGSAIFENRNLFDLGIKELSEIRGNRISIIFQEPMTSLNPSYRVGDQIAEVVLRHRDCTKSQARAHALEMMDRVKIPAAKQRLDDYPHQLSGGMRQRIMIAMALANDPTLLIADEPTTALDVTIQAQILELIRSLQQETGTALILITHDLGIVANIADEVAVMYAGHIVEKGTVENLFTDTQHPYTLGLMSAIPTLKQRGGRLSTVPGVVPNLHTMPSGCRFSPRCPFAVPDCLSLDPPDIEINPSHFAACIQVPLESQFREVAS